jgi:hypothetical protein
VQVCGTEAIQVMLLVNIDEKPMAVDVIVFVAILLGLVSS